MLLIINFPLKFNLILNFALFFAGHDIANGGCCKIKGYYIK